MMPKPPTFTPAVIEGQADISLPVQADNSAMLVLEVIGLMCDGQRRSLQDYLRAQPDNYMVRNASLTVESFPILSTAECEHSR